MASLLSWICRVFLCMAVCAVGCTNGGGVGATGSSGGGGGGGASSTSQPTVAAATVDGPSGAAFLNTSVAVLFSQPIDSATVTTSTFTVTTGGNPVPGSITSDGDAALFTPTTPLQPSTAYRINLSPFIRSRTGNSLAPFVSDFTTGTAIDSAPPAVASTTPATGAANVTSSSFSVIFSEPMDPTSVTPANILISGPSGVIPAKVIRTATAAVLTPTTSLASSTSYTATVTTGVRDLARNPLPANAAFTFSTGSVSTSSSPQIISVTPAEGAVGVALTTQVVAVFNEAVDQSTVTGSTFTLAAPSGTVPASVSVSGSAATFTPNAALLPLTLYRATVSSGIRTVSGTSLATAKTWTFTTGTATGTAPVGPALVSTTPQNGAAGILLTTPVIGATFDSAINPATVTPLTVTLSFSGVPVQFAPSVSGSTIRIVPFAPLQANTVYTATVTTGVKDTGGTPLAAPVTWNFTTGQF